MEPRERPQEWRQSTYDRFLAAEGIPVLSGLAVPDLKAVDVAPWARLGVKGAYIRLYGTEDTNDAAVLEIPPGGQTHPDRHLYEKYVFVVKGHGATTVWDSRDGQHAFEWGEGSLFSVPVNCRHQFFNGSGQQPARLLLVSLAPLLMNLFHNLEFVFDCPFAFKDRFDGAGDFFSPSGTIYKGRVWETNFIADVRSIKLYGWAERGAGGTNLNFEVANSTLAAHVSEFPVGTYKKCHRHGPGFHVIMLKGTGYTLMWPEGAEEWNEIPWQDGCMFVPPGLWWHQHFNTGAEPARYLAIRWGSEKYKVSRYLDDISGVDKSAALGGNQIEYEDQDPRVHRRYLDQCARNGVTVQMQPFHART